uniref:Putative ribonuclease H-like domain-containing protein n=1 Tax=Tanacetum cinerariifolium TaxID=118510 RepID=A0A6L2MWV8_TANCI|nr:putative ribonuclease H-like domain-containing protein [Tanacetum cinerariifolium]
MAIPEDHLAKFHKMTDAKEMWEAIKSRLGLHKGYDRFQSLLSQLKTHGAGVSTEDANQKFLSGPQLDHEDLEQVDEFDLEEMDLKWHVAMISTRLKKFYKKIGRKLHFDAKKPVGFDKRKVECFSYHNTGHFARECKSKGNQDSRRRDAGNIGYKVKNNGKRSAKHNEHKSMVTIDGEGVDWTGHAEDNTEEYALIAFNSSNSRSDTEKLLAEAEREKEELKTKLENFQSSSKGLSKLLNSQMSVKDKFGLGYGSQIHDGVLSYENEVFASVFDSRSSDVEDCPVNDRFAKVKGMHAVLPPMTGNYMPPKFDFGIDELKFAYGPKQSTTNESHAKTSDLIGPQLDHEDLEQIDEFDLEEMDLKWHVAMISTRLKKFYKKIGRKLHFDAKKPVGFDKRKVECFRNTRYKVRNNGKRSAKHNEHKAMVTIDGEGVDWTGHAKDNTEDYALIAFNSSNSRSDTEDNPHQTLNGKGIVDSGCSRHITRNKACLVYYQDFNCGPVTFGGSKGKIISKGNSKMEADHAQEYYVLPFWSSYTSTVKNSKAKNRDEKLNEDTDSKTNEEPVDQEDQAFLEELERLKRQEKEANDAAKTLRKTFAQSTKDLLLQVGISRASSTHYDERGVLVRNKARLVAHGHRQEEWIDYNEFFALVARIEAIRIFLAFASYMGFIVYQMDVKSAFLYGKINEEVYVSQPSGFIDPKFPNKVYKVVKALYGLHQALKAWFQYPKDSAFDLEAYSDSDYDGANLDRKSITIGCQFLVRRLISWQYKKQTIVATSTTKAEFVATASCCGQVLWIQNKMLDYSFNFMNTKIYIDNESTICIVKNPVFHSKTKHIEIRHHFIMDAYEKKLIQVLKIHTNNNVADLLNKVFDVSRFNFLIVNIRMVTLLRLGKKMQFGLVSGALNGGHTSDRAEGALNLEELFFISTNLSNRVLALETVKDAQAAEIISLKARIKKLEKKCKPSISHHRACIFDTDLDVDHGINYMDIEEPVNEGRLSEETEVLVSTARPEDNTVRPDVGTANPIAPPTTTTNIEDSSRPARSILTLKPLPTINPKDKGKGVLEEPEPAKKMTIRIKADELFAAKLQQEEREEYTIEEKEFDDDISEEYGWLQTLSAKVDKENVLEEPDSTKIEVKQEGDEESIRKRLEGVDLVLWGDLRTMFKETADDDLWKNQEEWILKSRNFYENCRVHTLTLEDGTKIYMLAERRYPFTKETLERMLALRLIAECESEAVFILLRFIQKQIDESGSHDGSEKDLAPCYCNEALAIPEQTATDDKDWKLMKEKFKELQCVWIHPPGVQEAQNE